MNHVCYSLIKQDEQLGPKLPPSQKYLMINLDSSPPAGRSW